jgi:hypothetical protein
MLSYPWGSSPLFWCLETALRKTVEIKKDDGEIAWYSHTSKVSTQRFYHWPDYRILEGFRMTVVIAVPKVVSVSRRTIPSSTMQSADARSHLR